MNLTDQGIVNELYEAAMEFMQDNGYARTLPNYCECLKLVVGAAKTILEDSQPYLEGKLEKL